MWAKEAIGEEGAAKQGPGPLAGLHSRCCSLLLELRAAHIYNTSVSPSLRGKLRPRAEDGLA